MPNDILSPALARKMKLAILSWEEQLKHWQEQHSFYSKYYNDILMQETMFMTQEQMLSKFYEAARAIELIEPDLLDYKQRLYRHWLAIAEAKKSNKPFDGINLKEHTLTQQTLF